MWKGHGGFEIALAPALFGGIGWLLDGYFGITPALTIVFAIVGLFGAVANQYYRFKYEFDKATEKRQAATSAEATDSATDQTPFGRVEPTPVDMSIDFGASDNVAEQVAS